jgi:rRNA maturation protein Nop10
MTSAQVCPRCGDYGLTPRCPRCGRIDDARDEEGGSL